MQWGGGGLVAPGCRLKKSHSAHELCWTSRVSDEEEEDENRPEKGLLLSPKERIKNMWQDFSVEKCARRHQRPGHHDSLSSLQSQPAGDSGERQGKAKGRRGVHKKVPEKKKKKKEEEEVSGGEGRDGWRPRVTIPQPFNMTMREAERKRRGIKTRAEVERENAELRRQLEELTECQRQFHANPVPAHVRQPLYDQLQRRDRSKAENGNGGTKADQTEAPASTAPRPFSFLERERLKREQREEELRRVAKEEAQDRRQAGFRAKPVPRAVREMAAANERLKEEQLYRAIKMQMRARDMLHNASMPPSMLARRLEERKQKEEKEGRGGADGNETDRASHRPKINADVPDFDASYRRFQKQLERGRREARLLTACEPFRLRTSSLPRRTRTDVAEVDASPRDYRWPFVNSPGPSPRQRRGAPHTSSYSLCSSLSSSQEVLTSKITDAARKRQEAIR